jgi:hypothetical protein
MNITICKITFSYDCFIHFVLFHFIFINSFLTLVVIFSVLSFGIELYKILSILYEFNHFYGGLFFLYFSVSISLFLCLRNLTISLSHLPNCFRTSSGFTCVCVVNDVYPALFNGKTLSRDCMSFS